MVQGNLRGAGFHVGCSVSFRETPRIQSCGLSSGSGFELRPFCICVPYTGACCMCMLTLESWMESRSQLAKVMAKSSVRFVLHGIS